MTTVTPQQAAEITNEVFAKMRGQKDRFPGCYAIVMIGRGIFSPDPEFARVRQLVEQDIDRRLKATASRWKSGVEHRLPPGDRD